jgi:hypothetical protein
VDKKSLLREELKVLALDENKLRQDAVIGRGTVSLRRACAQFGRPVQLTKELSNEQGAVTGTVVISATLSKLRPEEATDKIPESAIRITNGVLTVKKIVATDLVGADMFGNQVNINVVIYNQ